MKKILSLLLAVTMIMLTGSIIACNQTKPNEDDTVTTKPTENGDKEAGAQESADTTAPAETDTDSEPVDEKISLDGKKVIFIGNSHTYYGKTVISKTTTTQASRVNDKGMFYHLCRQKGMEVSVTNWTFASHNLPDTFSDGSCPKCKTDVNHKNELTDRYFDYVILQEGSAAATPESFVAIFKEVYDFFKEANPNVKFILTLSTRAVDGNYTWIPAVEELKNSHGLIVADLGNMVWDIVKGKTEVPGATLAYDKNSFIVCRTASDGYHPNLLTGYLTSLFVYCAITGESAVGQPYALATDTKLNSAFSTISFTSKYYTYQKPTTNFALILKSEADMNGLQQLVDKYLEKANGKNN